MYPARNGPSAFGSIAPQQMPPGWGAQTDVPPSPNSSLISYGSSSVSSLRIRVAEECRIDPPIPVSNALTLLSSEDGARGGQGAVPVELGLEQSILESSDQSGAVVPFFSALQGSELAEPGVRQFMDMGFTRAEAGLGLAYCQLMKLSQAEVADFASNYNQITSMGYSPILAAGALVHSKNNVNAATELCLSLPS